MTTAQYRIEQHQLAKKAIHRSFQSLTRKLVNEENHEEYMMHKMNRDDLLEANDQLLHTCSNELMPQFTGELSRVGAIALVTGELFYSEIGFLTEEEEHKFDERNKVHPALIDAARPERPF
ncbi:hypothetical protein ACQR3P_28720 [Rhodococcus sp. IEGM1300]